MNNKEALRKEVYEIVWSIITQQLMQHITINDDPEDDSLEDIGEQLEIGKYAGTFSWCVWREGQALTIYAYDTGNVSIMLEEQVHNNFMINLSYNDNADEFLKDLEKVITGLTYSFFEGSWHILLDYLCSASDNTGWRQMLALYKEYEIAHPDMCGNITYM